MGAVRVGPALQRRRASTSRSRTAGSSACAAAPPTASTTAGSDPKDLFGWQANNAPDRLTPPAGPRRRTARRDRLGHRDGPDRRPLARSCSPGPAAGAGSASTPAASCSSRSTTRSRVIGKAGIGTPHMDGNTRLCTATAAAALKASFGTDGQPGSYTDVDHCDAIALWGHNVAETQTVLWMRMLDRRRGADPPRDAGRRPAADAGGARGRRAPRRPQRHEPGADERAAPRAASSAAGSTSAYVDAHTLGFDELQRGRRRATRRERVAEICDVAGRRHRARPPSSSARRERLLSTVLQGFYQSNQATAAACQVNNLHLLRGMIGRPGAGVLPDERPADRAEHPRDRRRRRPARLPQLGQPGRTSASWPSCGTSTPAIDPALGAADPRHADLPLRRAGLDRAAVDLGDQPGGLAARPRPDPPHPAPGRAVRRRPGPVPDRDRRARRRGAAGGDVGREDRHVHQRRPHRAPLRARRSTRPARPAPTSTSSSTTPGAWTSATATASR